MEIRSPARLSSPLRVRRFTGIARARRPHPLAGPILQSDRGPDFSAPEGLNRRRPMRSSKSRSRNKSNRQRSIGNIINRVFDSSGPEGKVRGTPQQIIEKYLALARDAQLGNDRVAEQNFLQHAEHYTRMLGEAQREMAREQEERQRSFPQQGGNGGQNNGQPGGQSGNRERAERPEREPRSEEGAAMPEAFATEDDGPGLVVTPEMQAETAPAPAAPAQPVAGTAEAGAEPAPKKSSRSRSSASSRSRSPSARGKKSDKAEGQGDAAPAEAPAAPTGD
ncbi:hypothetical protein SDC9_18854 [bioreactor metagenome]|uniref:DUF4167 domain-containing protein n=1 Tax=bioreactor metagenome TaxID=1076179 RepID=A0A644U3W1_9ZZZZ